VPLSEAVIMRVILAGPSAELHRFVLTNVALKASIIKLSDLSFTIHSNMLTRRAAP